MRIGFMVLAITTSMVPIGTAHAAVKVFDYSFKITSSGEDETPGPLDGLTVNLKLSYDVDVDPVVRLQGNNYTALTYRTPVSVKVSGPLGLMTTATARLDRDLFGKPLCDFKSNCYATYPLENFYYNGVFANSVDRFYEFNFFLQQEQTREDGTSSPGNGTTLLSSLSVTSQSKFNRPFSGFYSSYDASAVNSAVPEPATWGMMMIGMGAIGFLFRLQKRTSVRAQAKRRSRA